MTKPGQRCREFGTDCGGLVVDESDGVEKPRHPPRLGEIEQLSTETQTDEFDALMGSVGQGKPSASHSGSNAQTLPSQPSPEDPEDPFGSHVGMPEDVLDILCSNYTQTCAGTPNIFELTNAAFCVSSHELGNFTEKLLKLFIGFSSDPQKWELNLR